MKPSPPETIPQRRMVGPGGARTWQLPWFSSTGEGRGGQLASLEHLLGTFASRVLTMPLYGRCDSTHFTDEDMEAQGRGRATCPSP